MKQSIPPISSIPPYTYSMNSIQCTMITNPVSITSSSLNMNHTNTSNKIQSLIPNSNAQFTTILPPIPLNLNKGLNVQTFPPRLYTMPVPALSPYQPVTAIIPNLYNNINNKIT